MRKAERHFLKNSGKILGDKLIVTLGYENSLIVVSEENWKALLKEQKESLLFNPKQEKLKDSYLGERQTSSSMLREGLYYRLILENLQKLKIMSCS